MYPRSIVISILILEFLVFMSAGRSGPVHEEQEGLSCDSHLQKPSVCDCKGTAERSVWHLVCWYVCIIIIIIICSRLSEIFINYSEPKTMGHIAKVVRGLVKDFAEVLMLIVR